MILLPIHTIQRLLNSPDHLDKPLAALRVLYQGDDDVFPVVLGNYTAVGMKLFAGAEFAEDFRFGLCLLHAFDELVAYARVGKDLYQVFVILKYCRKENKPSRSYLWKSCTREESFLRSTSL